MRWNYWEPSMVSGVEFVEWMILANNGEIFYIYAVCFFETGHDAG